MHTHTIHRYRDNINTTHIYIQTYIHNIHIQIHVLLYWPQYL